MEGKRSTANDKITKKRNEEYRIVTIFVGIVHSDHGEVDEDEVGEGVDDLCDISCKPVVLLTPMGERISMCRSGLGSCPERRANNRIGASQSPLALSLAHTGMLQMR